MMVRKKRRLVMPFFLGFCLFFATGHPSSIAKRFQFGGDHRRLPDFSSKILKAHSSIPDQEGGTMKREYTLGEVVRLTGIPYYRIYYGHYTGRIPEPRRVGRTRIYTEAEVRRIKEHFV